MGSKLYGVGKGRKVRISKTSASPRQHAAQLRAWGGAHKRGDNSPDWERARRWKPKRRRKLGARRKVTLIQQLFTWIKIPTKVRRRTRRR